MNKQVSVQYAYKKDGKGERHGDQAERMLAAEAKKNMTQPAVPALPVPLFATQTTNAANALMDPDLRRSSAQNTNSAGTPFANGRSGMTYPQLPTPSQPRSLSQPQTLASTAASGLPPRPPPSQAGYGGPQNFLPPGFNIPQNTGFSAPGPPPGLPPGFQPTSTLRNQ